MTRKTVGWLSVAFLLLGTLAFLNNNLVMDMFHGMMYMVTGLFAAAAAMQGEQNSKRFSQVAGVFYAAFGILGFVSGHGPILGLVKTTFVENLINIVLGAVLLQAAYGLLTMIRHSAARLA